jgi:hypothetical protein
VRDHSYHTEMPCSSLIKRVLPCLVPEPGYAQPGRLRDGPQARAVWLELTAAGPDTAGREALRRDPLSCYALDTRRC